MKHIGDITKVHGDEITPVNVICGGSPCQDLSVAGLRKGLSGERSGLYMEQIRIVKEMREATNNTMCRYLIWENVPGAFSSAKGADLKAVFEEAIKVVNPNIPPLEVPKKGWPTAGVIYFDGGSLAWRVHDAQYWGVPQRRRRICMLVDYNGDTAPKLVFGEPLDGVRVEKKGSKPSFMQLTLTDTIFGDKAWFDSTASAPNYDVGEMYRGTKLPLWRGDIADWTDEEALLSNVLEDNVDKKYMLSPTACRGILTRAERRGKELPEELRRALEEQSKEE